MSVSDIAYVEAKIAALHQKLSATKNEQSQFYYRECIRGWVTTLEKLKIKESRSHGS